MYSNDGILMAILPTIAMSFFFSVNIRTKCYNFTVSIASIDHFGFVEDGCYLIDWYASAVAATCQTDRHRSQYQLIRIQCIVRSLNPRQVPAPGL